MTLPLRKETSLHLHILPTITKGENPVMKILITFNGRLSTDVLMLIQMIMLTLEKLFPLDMPLKMHH